VVLIAESHISVHTFPEKAFMSVDIFSCKCFDVERAIRYMVERFQVGRYEHQLLDRGRHFPKDEETVTTVMGRQRLISGTRGLVRTRTSEAECAGDPGSALNGANRDPSLRSGCPPPLRGGAPVQGAPTRRLSDPPGALPGAVALAGAGNGVERLAAGASGLPHHGEPD
jgi:hypothetical protein